MALQLGHRKSLDIDLFAHEDFNVRIKVKPQILLCVECEIGKL